MFFFTKKSKKITLLILLLLLSLEAIVRVFGLVDFPLYTANDLIGYEVKPNQSGLFMNKNKWEFNSMGMGAKEFIPQKNKTNILLIGDSIVYGGNSYHQFDRLGPKMESLLDSVQVWPISAGSWALKNELTWLEMHPEIIFKVDKIYFVLNRGDFAAPSSWKCETTHPLEKPVVAIIYLFKKYIWDWSYCEFKNSPFPVRDDDWRHRLKNFLGKLNAKEIKVIFYLYPNKEESNDKYRFAEWNMSARNDLILAGAKNVVALFEKEDLPKWFYSDEIHPSALGMKKLAESILAADEQ